MATRAMTGVHCTLCGLPAGAAVYKGTFDGAEKLFCCHGCLHVFTILRESGALAEGADPRDTDLFRKSLAAGIVSFGTSEKVSCPRKTRSKMRS